jgi:uncharacterized membrane protein YiaA
MSKRKRASKPDPDESPDDASAKDDMVHVSSDMLAGSPDIFSGKQTEAEPSEEPVQPTEAGSPPTPSEPAPEPPAPEEPVTEEPAPEELAMEEPAAPAAAEATPPAAPPLAPFVNAVPQEYPRQRRGASSTAIGIVLVVIGVFALIIVLSGVDLTESGWPLFIIIPGLTLTVIGFVSLGGVATIPGGILTMLGIVLAYSNSTGDWPIWAYGWSLVIPFGLGLGIYLQALRDRDQPALRTGRTLLFVGVMIFLIGFVLFESILGISGRDYFGPIGKAALPVLLILVGVILLVRSMQRSRQA